MKNATVTIGRTQSTREDDFISIEIQDRDSRNRVIELSMTYEQFAKCITGLGYVDAKVRGIVSAENFGELGKKLVSKQINLETTLRKYGKKEEAELRELVYASVPDGWKMNNDGMTSQQNAAGIHNFSVYQHIDLTDEDDGW
jgi:hypothetical protein